VTLSVHREVVGVTHLKIDLSINYRKSAVCFEIPMRAGDPEMPRNIQKK
jgi:hypothetical protein